jgi:hypothetical protein
MIKLDVITLTIIVLFDLFDFNELESLSPTDIEFMIYCCMSATFKIYSISSEINNEELTLFATKYFEKDNRLTVVELIKYIIH